MFRMDLAMICESHHKDDIGDFNKYHVKNVYGNSKEETVNLNYIAVILRIADLLHITRDRTPSITRKLVNISNPISVVEWEKQEAVRAVQPKSKRDGNENINEKLEKDTIEVTAYFEGAENADAYFGLSSYLQYTRKELNKCYEIVEKAIKKEGAVDYKFPWREIDESRITVKGFETKKLQFTIAQENILQLLVGHTLYNDSSVVVRELVQNAIDAVKLQNQYEIKNSRMKTEGKNCINLRKVNGSYLLSKIEKQDVDQRIRMHGTMVRLYVRNEIDMSTVEADLRKWIVLPEIPVSLTYRGKNEVKIGYGSLKDVLIKYLNDAGRTVDREKYDVYEEIQGNVTVAYAVKHLRYLSDW